MLGPNAAHKLSFYKVGHHSRWQRLPHDTTALAEPKVEAFEQVITDVADPGERQQCGYGGSAVENSIWGHCLFL